MGHSPRPLLPPLPHDSMGPRRIRHHVHQSVMLLLQLNFSSKFTPYLCQIGSFRPSFAWDRHSRHFEGKASTSPLWILPLNNSTREVGWVSSSSLCDRELISIHFKVHLYGEGKVNQPDRYPQDENGLARLPRFKWGVYVFFHPIPHLGLLFKQTTTVVEW